MKKHLIIVLLIFTQISCAQNSEKSNENKTDIEYTRNYTISLINLISTPEKYHGKKVQIIGYISLDFEKNGIYLNKDDYEYAIYSNGFSFSLPEGLLKKSGNKIDKSYVLLAGTFNMNPKGKLGPWSGKLENITRIISMGNKTNHSND